METQSVKPKRKRAKHSVQIQCTKCQSLFSARTFAHLCPNCRPKSKPAKAQQQPGAHQPAPQESKRTRKNRAIDQATRAMANSSLSSRVTSLTNRVSKSSAMQKPGVGPRSAACRLLLQMLSPADALGQKPIRINVDEVQAPKYPIQIDNNFTLTGNGEFKCMLASSPLISAVIFTPNPLTVSGARAITFGLDQGFLTYVVSNKIGYLADEEQLIITPKEDFRKYRMIGAAMQMQWSGLELTKNGTFVCARITDKENLVSFNPNQKPDSVIANGSDVITLSCQHDDPIFSFTDVDPSNESGSGNKPTPGQGEFAVESIVIEYSDNVQLPMRVTPPSLAFVVSTSYRTVAQSLLNAYNAAKANQPLNGQITQFIEACAAKYPNFRSQAAQPLYNAAIEVEVPFETAGAVANRSFFRYETENVSANTPVDYITNILEASQTLVNTQAIDFGTGNATIYSSVKITLHIPVDGKINQRAQIPQPLTNGIAQNTLNDTPFYDGSFLQPVAHYQGGEFTYQVITSHSWEFILSDDTVLATAAVANSPTDPVSCMNKQQFNAFQKIMKALPPCLIQSPEGMTRATTSQLASRGILNDIFKFAGPIVGTIFPPAAPIIGALQPVVSVVDNML